MSEYLTNGVVYEWFEELVDKSVSNLSTEFKKKFCDFQCKPNSIFNKVRKLKMKVQTLKKNKNSKELEKFFTETFVVPSAETNFQRALSVTSNLKEICISSLKKLANAINRLKGKLTS